MAMTNKKDLYMAKDLEELNSWVANNPALEKAKSVSCAQMTNLIEVTWTEAKKSEGDNDEERAYVLYMRLVACFTALRQAKDFATNQKTYQHYFKGANLWLEKADQLSDSLKHRYDARTAAQQEEERKRQAEVDEEQSITKTIVPRILYKFLRDPKKNILLIDMRSKEAYDQSHLRTPVCIHIPADLMDGRGWTPWNVETALTDQVACAKFKQRSTFDFIVLFDEDSYEADLKPGHSLMGLKQAIFYYEQDNKLKREPVILDGGYEDWMSYYPGESTAPLLTKKNNGDLRSFEVSYPEDVYIPQEVPSNAATAVQPEVIEIPPAVMPQIDRTRKPMTNQKPDSPVIEQQELPIQPTPEEQPPPTIIKEQPHVPNRSIKPVLPTGPSSTTQVIPDPPVQPDNLPRPSAVEPGQSKKDSDRENIPPPPPVMNLLPSVNRQNLPALDTIYRPFKRVIPANENNQQYRKQFDAVTGRKIFLDTKNNRLVPDIPENERFDTTPGKVPETPLRPTPSVPTINRENKPLMTEQMRRQIAIDYRAIADTVQVNRRTGLKNLGNSCYMNSVIQSLGYNTILTAYFLSGKFKNDINETNKLGSRGAVANEWFRVMYALWCQQFSSIAPEPFKYTVGKIQHAYWDTQQQDAHEFLVFLLDSLHEDLNQATRPRTEELKSENYKSDRSLAEATKKVFRSHNQSIIIDLFYGLFKSTTTCLSCAYSSARFEAFAIISVPIPPVRQCSLNECLDLFREYERLTGQERFQCPKCKRRSDAQRRLDIWELPQIFIVHFKRFRLHQTHFIKNETLIRYPISNVDFSRWSLTSTTTSSTTRYSLVSVVNHFGSMNSGHYTSYCNDGKQWYYCDDQSIRPADKRELENNVHAYLLFYSTLPTQQLRLPITSA